MGTGALAIGVPSYGIYLVRTSGFSHLERGDLNFVYGAAAALICAGVFLLIGGIIGMMGTKKENRCLMAVVSRRLFIINEI